jgi:hypothetical protein
VKSAILLLLTIFPVHQEMSLDLLLPKTPLEIFSEFRNGNFTQELIREKQGMIVRIRSRNYFDLSLDEPLLLDSAYVDTLDARLREAVVVIFRKRPFLGDFLKNISVFLGSSVRYSEEEIPQDPLSVLMNGKAYCVGYCNLVQVLLRSAGISSRFVRGFYLPGNQSPLTPVSHRWLEIRANAKMTFFYDPQYQNFSSHYLVLNQGVPFEQIEKFKGYIIGNRNHFTQ